MPFFKHKPTIIEAIQYQKGRAFEVEGFIGTELSRDEEGKIEMIHGCRDIVPGDFVFRHSSGRIYSMSQEDFEKEYEPTKKKPQPFY